MRKFTIIFIFLLMHSVANATKIKDIIIEGNERVSTETILMFSDININENIDEKKLNAILNALEIEINSVSESGIGMTIPRYRVDVTRPADVIEEILRIYGYDKILDVPLKYEASLHINGKVFTN
mgnify:CR=1 FL=1